MCPYYRVKFTITLNKLCAKTRHIDCLEFGYLKSALGSYS